VVIGNSSPLAGAFTTVTTSGAISETIASGNAQASLTLSDLNSRQVVLRSPDPLGTQAQVGTTTSHNLELLRNNVAIATVSSTGVAVTGTLSATGTLSGGTSGTAYSFSGSAPATSLTLISSGNLGIGTSSPTGYLANKLVVATGTDSNNGITIASASNRNGSIWFADGTTGDQSYRGGVDYQHTADTLYLYSGAAGWFQLTSAGNVGLGGVTPSAWGGGRKALQVGTATSLFDDASGSAALSANAYYDGSVYRYLVTTGASAYTQSNGSHVWRTAASGTAGNTISFTEAMTLEAGGNLGLGTTSVTTGIAQRVLQITNGTNGCILFGSGATQNPIPRIFGSDTYDLNIATGVTTGKMVFYTNDTVRMKLPAAGGVQAVTTVSVGDATPSASGAGITFPASQSASSDANTLDDYEEGTWTPADASGASLSFTVTSATYTKIGRIVNLFSYFAFPSNASTNPVLISGLPFTAATNTFAPVICETDAGIIAYIRANGGGTNLDIRLINGDTQVLNSTMSTRYVIFSMTYQT